MGCKPSSYRFDHLYGVIDPATSSSFMARTSATRNSARGIGRAKRKDDAATTKRVEKDFIGAPSTTAICSHSKNNKNHKEEDDKTQEDTMSCSQTSPLSAAIPQQNIFLVLPPSLDIGAPAASPIVAIEQQQEQKPKGILPSNANVSNNGSDNASDTKLSIMKETNDSRLTTTIASLLGICLTCHAAGYWCATQIKSTYPMNVCSGLTLILVALLPPALLFGKLNTQTLWSSAFLVLYVVKLLALEYMALHPREIQLYALPALWKWLKCSKLPKKETIVSLPDLLSSLNRLYHSQSGQLSNDMHASADPDLTVYYYYQLANLLWITCFTAPHIFASCLGIGNNKNNNQWWYRVASAVLALLGSLTCVVGLLCQGLAIWQMSSTEYLEQQDRWDQDASYESSARWISVAKMGPELTSRVNQQLDQGELLFWMGLLLLNTDTTITTTLLLQPTSCKLSARVMRGFLMVVAITVPVLAALIWTRTLRDVEETGYIGNWIQYVPPCPEPLAAFVAATEAVFLRYNVFSMQAVDRIQAIHACLISASLLSTEYRYGQHEW